MESINKKPFFLADFQRKIEDPALRHIGHLRRQIELFGPNPATERHIAQIEKTLKKTNRKECLKKKIFFATVRDRPGFLFPADVLRLSLTCTKAPDSLKKIASKMIPDGFDETKYGPPQGVIFGLEKLHLLIKNLNPSYSISPLELPPIDEINKLLETDFLGEMDHNLYYALKFCSDVHADSENFSLIAVELLNRIDPEAHPSDYNFYYSQLEPSIFRSFMENLFLPSEASKLSSRLHVIGSDALKRYSTLEYVSEQKKIQLIAKAIKAHNPAERTEEMIEIACQSLDRWKPGLSRIFREVANHTPGKTFHDVAREALLLIASITGESHKAITSTSIYRVYQEIRGDIPPVVNTMIIQNIFGWSDNPKLLEFCMKFKSRYSEFEIGIPLHDQTFLLGKTSSMLESLGTDFDPTLFTFALKHQTLDESGLNSILDILPKEHRRTFFKHSLEHRASFTLYNLVPKIIDKFLAENDFDFEIFRDTLASFSLLKFNKTRLLTILHSLPKQHHSAFLKCCSEYVPHDILDELRSASIKKLSLFNPTP
ncbi:MAG: hypothetical protein MRY21_06860 [Simkaniaceae bacterium]|nr:hypothetical protein [Simkaniaceae bacterium]